MCHPGKRLDVLHVDLNGNALHDHVEREHNAKVVFLAKQQAFHPGHYPGANADPRPCSEIRMRFDFSISKPFAKKMDVRVWDWQGLRPAHDIDNPWYL